jgi:hypothetical protein
MPQYAAPIAKAAQLFKLKGDLERMEALVSSIKWKPSGERTHIKTNPDSNKSFTRTNIITCYIHIQNLPNNSAYPLYARFELLIEW